MNIQGSIIEQLGLKQYDTVSAVVAELVANAWDADAENVTIELPLNTYLATRSDGELEDKGSEIVVRDDGHGMDPEGANERFLNVGRKRREVTNSDTSRQKNRPVMGRKGIGKLAPFGLCYQIEVISSGGEESEEGYQISHFILEYDDIENTSPKEEYEPKRGDQDGDFRDFKGTEIRLTDFDYKRVPNKKQFANMLSYRFADGLSDFSIYIDDTRDNGIGKFDLSETEQPLRDNTKIDVSDSPLYIDEEKYVAEGHMGLATKSYDNEMQGVRIYVRGKLASVTRDFNISSGFHMENTIRSYLVGEIHCDFLDKDMDCIQANRQDILWDTKYGRKLERWGQKRVREVADKAREPKRKSRKNKFFDKTDFEQKAEDEFDDEELVEASKELGETLAGTLDEDELDDEEFLERFVNLILQIAPHDTVVRTFKQIREEAQAGTLQLDELNGLISKTSVAETQSLAQVASQKVDIIQELREMVNQGVEDERQFQELVEEATWLINPEWQALTKDERISTFRQQFESWYENQYEEELTTSITSAETKQPDFIMVSRDNFLVVVEIKPPGHTFRSGDLDRFSNYVRAFEEFEENHGEAIDMRFPNGIKFVLIVDEVGLDWQNEQVLKQALDNYGYGEQPKSWQEILQESEARYRDFLEVRE
ncbi:ATP-binding protein [Haloarculaceae archaeon H-GB2-1]|nr:ATP-binding protein [Haloarculaceae archaeon H-GB1-1]MEA5408602.1 ATP-binding protein [Haloarculaceae archaeon H-GB2-1]